MAKSKFGKMVILKFFDGVPLQSFLGLRGPLRLHHGGHGHGGHGHGGHGEHGHGGHEHGGHGGHTVSQEQFQPMM